MQFINAVHLVVDVDDDDTPSYIIIQFFFLQNLFNSETTILIQINSREQVSKWLSNQTLLHMYLSYLCTWIVLLSLGEIRFKIKLLTKPVQNANTRLVAY